MVRTVQDAYAAKKQAIGEPVLEHFEKAISLQVLDQFWREHLAAMDYLRQGIHLRGYAQKDPKQEYKREAYTMFNEVLARFKHEVISVLARVQIQAEADVQAVEAQRRKPREMEFKHEDAQSAADAATAAAAPPPAAGASPAGSLAGGRPIEQAPTVQRPQTQRREMPKVGRNEPCPCGSGKKYKQCHGKLS